MVHATLICPGAGAADERPRGTALMTDTGMTVEAAAGLGVPARTVGRGRRMARGWLHRHLDEREGESTIGQEP
jgi:hypothetical protein